MGTNFMLFHLLSESKALIRSIKTINSYGIYSGNFSCNWGWAKNICIADALDLEKHCDSRGWRYHACSKWREHSGKDFRIPDDVKNSTIKKNKVVRKTLFTFVPECSKDIIYVPEHKLRRGNCIASWEFYRRPLIIHRLVWLSDGCNCVRVLV